MDTPSIAPDSSWDSVYCKADSEKAKVDGEYNSKSKEGADMKTIGEANDDSPNKEKVSYQRSDFGASRHRRALYQIRLIFVPLLSC
jgi:hypothetical protein